MLGTHCLSCDQERKAQPRVPYRELAELPAEEIFAEIERQDDGLRAQRWMLKLVVIELKRRLEAQC